MNVNTGFGIRQTKTSSEKNAVKLITGWLQKRLPENSKDDSVQCMVTEVQCNQPDCVPIETLVIVTGAKGKWMSKILRPIIEVEESDVKQLDLPSDLIAYINQKENNTTTVQDEQLNGKMDIFLEN